MTDEPIERCPGCLEPAHPCDTDDDGFHAQCRTLREARVAVHALVRLLDINTSTDKGCTRKEPLMDPLNNKDQEERHFARVAEDAIPMLKEAPHALRLLDRAQDMLDDINEPGARTLAAAIRLCLSRAGWCP